MKRSLNLLSERSRKRNQLRRSMRLWARVLCVVMLLTSIVGITKWRACSKAHAEQVAVEAEYEPIRQLKIENGRLRKQIAELEKAEIIPLKLAVHEPLLALMGVASQVVREQQQSAYLNQLEIEREPLALEPNERSLVTVHVEGVSMDKSSAEQIASSIRELGPFARVDLKTRDLAISNAQQQLAFSIECTNQVQAK